MNDTEKLEKYLNGMRPPVYRLARCRNFGSKLVPTALDFE
jgi:hypothetical protein